MKNPSKNASPLSNQVRELRTELARRIASFMGSEENRATDIPGVTLHRPIAPTAPCSATIYLVRQSAKRRTAPAILMPAEIKALINGLAHRERTLVLLAASTGLRQSELFGLKWGNVDFDQGTMSVTRSIVYGVVGPCKTESSQKPVPIHPTLADALMQWRKPSTSIQPDDWVFASKRYRGRRPYWGQAILRKYIRPIAQRVGIQKRFGWHTLRHTYSTLLRSVGTEFKVMQELLRHSSLRSTLDVYTQAVTPAKHAAQAAVLSLVFSCDANGTSQSSASGEVGA